MPNVKLTEQQVAFLVSYLGADIPEGPSIGELRDEIDLANLNPADVWIEAMAEVDVSLGSLKAHLAGNADPNLDRIAKLGLLGVTGGNHRALMGAFLTYGSAPGEARVRAGQDLLKVVDQVEAFVANDEIITLLEEFPGGPPASIRMPLGRAFSQIRQIVAA